MAEKGVDDKKSTRDTSSNPDGQQQGNRGGHKKRDIGPSDRVLRSQKSTSGEGSATEKAKGKRPVEVDKEAKGNKPAAKKRNLTINEGGVMRENEVKAQTPVKGNVGGSSSRVLRSQTARAREEKVQGKKPMEVDEKTKAKAKKVKKTSEAEEIAEKVRTPMKRRGKGEKNVKEKSDVAGSCSSTSRVLRSNARKGDTTEEGNKSVEKKSSSSAVKKKSVAGEGSSTKVKKAVEKKSSSSAVKNKTAAGESSSTSKGQYALRQRKGAPQGNDSDKQTQPSQPKRKGGAKATAEKKKPPARKGQASSKIRK